MVCARLGKLAGFLRQSGTEIPRIEIFRPSQFNEMKRSAVRTVPLQLWHGANNLILNEVVASQGGGGELR